MCYFIVPNASRGDWTSWEHCAKRAHHNQQSSSSYVKRAMKSLEERKGRSWRLSTSSASDSEDTGRSQQFMLDSGAAISVAHIRENTSVYTAQSSRSAAVVAGGKGALESKYTRQSECSGVLRCDTVWLGEWFLNSSTAWPFMMKALRFFETSGTTHPIKSHITSATTLWETKISHRHNCRIIFVPVPSLTCLIPKDKKRKAKIKKKTTKQF
jgi:hypothetical protein